MNTVKVVNIKCGGCAAGIISALNEKGLKDVKVDVANQTVSFTGDLEIARNTLTKMGYPEAGTRAAQNLLKKAKSYVSCLIGKTKK